MKENQIPVTITTDSYGNTCYNVFIDASHNVGNLHLTHEWSFSFYTDGRLCYASELGPDSSPIEYDGKDIPYLEEYEYFVLHAAQKAVAEYKEQNKPKSMTYQERVVKFNKFAKEHPEYEYFYDGKTTIVYVPADNPWEFSRRIGYMDKDENFIPA